LEVFCGLGKIVVCGDVGMCTEEEGTSPVDGMFNGLAMLPREYLFLG